MEKENCDPYSFIHKTKYNTKKDFGEEKHTTEQEGASINYCTLVVV